MLVVALSGSAMTTLSSPPACQAIPQNSLLDRKLTERPISPIDERVKAFWNNPENLANFAEKAVECCRKIGIENLSERLQKGADDETYLRLHYELTQIKMTAEFLLSKYLHRTWKEQILPHLYYDGLKVPIVRIDDYYHLGDHPVRNWHLAVSAIKEKFRSFSITDIRDTWETILESKQNPDALKIRRIIYRPTRVSIPNPFEAKSSSESQASFSNTSASSVITDDDEPPTIERFLSSTRIARTRDIARTNMPRNNSWSPEEEEHFLMEYVALKADAEKRDEQPNDSAIIRAYLKLTKTKYRFPIRSEAALTNRLNGLKITRGLTDDFEFDLTGKRRETFIQSDDINVHRAAPKRSRKAVDSDGPDEEWQDDSEDDKQASRKPTLKPKKLRLNSNSTTLQVATSLENLDDVLDVVPPVAAESSTSLPNKTIAHPPTSTIKRWKKNEEDHLCESMRVLIPKYTNLNLAYQAYAEILKIQDVLPYKSKNTIGEMWRFLRNSGYLKQIPDRGGST